MDDLSFLQTFFLYLPQLIIFFLSCFFFQILISITSEFSHCSNSRFQRHVTRPFSQIFHIILYYSTTCFIPSICFPIRTRRKIETLDCYGPTFFYLFLGWENDGIRGMNLWKKTNLVGETV